MEQSGINVCAITIAFTFDDLYNITNKKHVITYIPRHSLYMLYVKEYVMVYAVNEINKYIFVPYNKIHVFCVRGIVDTILLCQRRLTYIKLLHVLVTSSHNYI